jgi:hypothetical protein
MLLSSTTSPNVPVFARGGDLACSSQKKRADIFKKISCVAPDATSSVDGARMPRITSGDAGTIRVSEFLKRIELKVHKVVALSCSLLRRTWL